MLDAPMLRKMLLVSFLAHFLFFGFFSFSFGGRILKLDYPEVNFLGSFLGPLDLTWHSNPGKKISLEKGNAFMPQTKVNKEMAPLDYYRKPAVSLAGREEKIFYAPLESLSPPLPRRRGSVIMLYPPLPYHFLLYFKDRQRAHIELKFSSRPGAKSSSLVLKRKISSGNLEVDLLCMRYIGHYLFTQTAYLTANAWSTIKIDLEPRKE